MKRILFLLSTDNMDRLGLSAFFIFAILVQSLGEALRTQCN